MDNKNYSAFPVPENPYSEGLTKREWMAGIALSGLLANSTINKGYTSSLDWSKQAVEFADAVLTELEKRP